MTVYVDDMYRYALGRFGRMKMSHMIADTTEELVAMADRIGVARRWIQKPGTPDEHFDVAMSARKKAIAAGAVEMEMRELVRMWRARAPDGRLTPVRDATDVFNEKLGAKVGMNYYPGVECEHGYDFCPICDGPLAPMAEAALDGLKGTPDPYYDD